MSDLGVFCSDVPVSCVNMSSGCSAMVVSKSLHSTLLVGVELYVLWIQTADLYLHSAMSNINSCDSIKCQYAMSARMHSHLVSQVDTSTCQF